MDHLTRGFSRLSGLLLVGTLMVSLILPGCRKLDGVDWFEAADDADRGTSATTFITGRVVHREGSILAAGIRPQFVETPIPSATVRLENDPEVSAVSGPDGAFTLGPLPPDTYRVVATIRSPNGKIFRQISSQVQTSPAAIRGDAGTLEVIEANLIQRGTLVDAQGNPLRNARVVMWGEYVETDENGNFTSPLMPGGAIATLSLAARQTNPQVVPLVPQGLVGQLNFNFHPTDPVPQGTIALVPPAQADDLVSSRIQVYAPARQVLPGAQVPLYLTFPGLNPADLTITWSVTNGTESLNLDVNRLSGTWTAPTVPGSYTITCTVRDPQGRQTVRQIGVLVTTTPRSAYPPGTAGPFAGPARVVAGGDLTVSFDQPVQLGTSGRIRLVDYTTGTVAETLDLANPTDRQRLRIVNGNLQIVPRTGLSGGSYCSVLTEGDALRDRNGNPLAPVTDRNQFSFFIVEPPPIGTLNPGANVTRFPTRVAPNGDIVLDYPTGSQLRDTGQFIIRAVEDASVADTVDLTRPQDRNRVRPENGQIILNSPSLPANRPFYLTTEGRPVAAADGQVFADIKETVRFLISTDRTPPSLPGQGGLEPMPPATGIALRPVLTLTFAEPVIKMPGGQIHIRRSADDRYVETISFDTFVESAQVRINGNQVTITLSQPLTPGTGYYVDVPAGAFGDPTGNPFPGFDPRDRWSFTTTGTGGNLPTPAQPTDHPTTGNDPRTGTGTGAGTGANTGTGTGAVTGTSTGTGTRTGTGAVTGTSTGTGVAPVAPRILEPAIKAVPQHWNNANYINKKLADNLADLKIEIANQTTAGTLHIVLRQGANQTGCSMPISRGAVDSFGSFTSGALDGWSDGDLIIEASVQDAAGVFSASATTTLPGGLKMTPITAKPTVTRWDRYDPNVFLEWTIPAPTSGVYYSNACSLDAGDPGDPYGWVFLAATTSTSLSRASNFRTKAQYLALFISDEAGNRSELTRTVNGIPLADWFIFDRGMRSGYWRLNATNGQASINTTLNAPEEYFNDNGCVAGRTLDNGTEMVLSAMDEGNYYHARPGKRYFTSFYVRSTATGPVDCTFELVNISTLEPIASKTVTVNITEANTWTQGQISTDPVTTNTSCHLRYKISTTSNNFERTYFLDCVDVYPLD